MPSWGEILQQIQERGAANNGVVNVDDVRKPYVAQMAAATGRSTIVYYSDWLNKGGPAASINLLDMQGLMEVCRGLPGPSLDIILHSPGGTAEAAASIVSYLRQKYSDIRVFVPLAAMSAATMWALSANRIVMGKHSQLGPIDPQVSLTPGGIAMPARTILDQFERAKAELSAQPSALPAWAPIISQYGPGLLEMCQAAEQLGKGLVKDWLENYMFATGDDPAAKTAASEKAQRVADFFGNYTLHKSHSIGIFRDQAIAEGVTIDALEDENAVPANLQDIVLSIHHATLLTFNMSNCIKLIENHMGRGFYVQQAPMMQPGQMVLSPPFMQPRPPQPPPGNSRQP